MFSGTCAKVISDIIHLRTGTQHDMLCKHEEFAWAQHQRFGNYVPSQDRDCVVHPHIIRRLSVHTVQVCIRTVWEAASKVGGCARWIGANAGVEQVTEAL